MGILKRIKKSDADTKATEEKVEDVVAAPKATKKKVASKKSKSSKASETNVILRPLVTEKTAVLASAGKYVFVVSTGANRIQVKTAIKEMFGVAPTSVNIQNVRGKRVRFGKRRGKRSDWKKAVVSLPKGQKINVYEGV